MSKHLLCASDTVMKKIISMLTCKYKHIYKDKQVNKYSQEIIPALKEIKQGNGIGNTG